MIKKIIWTIVLIIPLSVGISGATGGVSDFFNTSNIIGNWKDWFSNKDYGLITNIQSDAANWWDWTKTVFMLIWVLIWTAPLWYAWKGTFIVGWVPLLGFVLRFVLLAVLLFAPSVLLGIQEVTGGTWATTAEPYMAAALIILALIGLWFKS